MSLRCPLCLEPLQSGTQFYRFCPQHPQVAPAFMVDDGDYSGIYCPHPDCRPSASTLNMNVFLLHEDCRCLNPFWDGSGLNLSRTMAVTVGANPVPVSHWQLGILRQAGGVYSDRKEMWFPQVLFRSVNEYWHNVPFGSLILMAGAPRCGKTVLSLMAMSRSSFDPTITIDHFVHVTQAVSSSPPEHLLRTMHALDVLRKDTPPAGFCASDEILATDANDLSNLKSAYLWLKTPVVNRKGAKQTQMGPWGLLIHVLQSFRPTPNSNKGRQVDRSPTHLVFALYDTAGELWNSSDHRLLALRARVDTMAIILDVTSLSFCRDLTDQSGNPIPNDSPDSTWLACEWLENAVSTESRSCLVVTKLDLLEVHTEAKAYLDAVRAAEKPAQAPRDLLVMWLSKSNAKEHRLLRLIQGAPDLPVFFAWTEDLNNAGHMPTAYGLGDLVNWCVDVQRWIGTQSG